MLNAKIKYLVYKTTLEKKSNLNIINDCVNSLLEHKYAIFSLS